MNPLSSNATTPLPLTGGAGVHAERFAVRLPLAVGAALLATLLVLAALLLLINRADWWRGLAAAGIASALAAGVSIVPLLLGAGRGLNGAVTGYFIAAGARAIISLGGCLLAVLVGGYPAAPTMLLMVPFYFAVLAAETAVVVRLIWNAKA